MRSIRLIGFALTVAAIGCNSPTTSNPPPSTTTPPGPSGSADQPSTSSVFDALKSEAKGHIPLEGMVTQEDIVADQAGVAKTTDPHLLNAWGLAFNPAGPAWVSSNGNGTSQVYDDSDPNLTKLLLEVTIPPPSGGMPPS